MKVRTSFWTLQQFRQTRPSRNSYMCHAPMPLRNEVKKFKTSGCATAKKNSTPQLFTPKPVSKRTWSRETLTAASMLQWTHCTTSNEGLVSALSLRNSYSVHERNLTIHNMRRGNSAKWFMATWKAPRRRLFNTTLVDTDAALTKTRADADLCMPQAPHRVPVAGVHCHANIHTSIDASCSRRHNPCILSDVGPRGEAGHCISPDPLLPQLPAPPTGRFGARSLEEHRVAPQAPSPPRENASRRSLDATTVRATASVLRLSCRATQCLETASCSGIPAHSEGR